MVSCLVSALSYHTAKLGEASLATFGPPLELLYRLAGEAAGDGHSYDQQSHTPLLTTDLFSSFALIATALIAYIL